MAMLLLGCGLFSLTAEGKQRTRVNADAIALSWYGGKLSRAVGMNDNVGQLKLRLRSSQLSCLQPDVALDTLHEAFYVYAPRQDDSSGFVIVSGDDRMPDVLAYSDNGVFRAEDMSPATRYWLSCYVADYCALEKSDALPELLTDGRQTATDNGVEPLLGNLWWGQGDPYNRHCPILSGSRCLVGCVATAMSQVMSLHRWPACGEGSIDYTTFTHHIQVSYDFSKHPIAWDKLLSTYKRNFTNEESEAVAQLMAGCGAAVHMDYGTDASGAYQHDLLKAFVRHFGYDPDGAFLPRSMFNTADWHRLLQQELNEGRAVNYAGQSQSDGGHSFVIDGYQYSQSGTNYPYYHLNWGWNGSCDGYYQLSMLNPTTNGRATMKDGFNTDQQMLVGVKPDDHESHPGSMLWADGLKVMMARLKPGQTTILHIGELTNLSYRTYHEPLTVVLCDSMGNHFPVAIQTLHPLGYLDSEENLNVPLTMPDTIPSGRYNLLLGYRDLAGNLSKAYSKSQTSIMVTDADDNPLPSTETPVLCSSEMEAYNGSGGGTEFGLRIYEVYNYSDDPFEGYARMEVARTDGTTLFDMGSSGTVGWLDTQEVAQQPIQLSAVIPDTLQPGRYRIYVACYDADGQKQCRIMFYDRMQKGSTPVTLYLDMTVNDTEIMIGNIRMNRTKSHIAHAMSHAETDKVRCFSVNGIMGKSKGRGVYILNGRKGIGH